jgi:hypothetical protein
MAWLSRLPLKSAPLLDRRHRISRHHHSIFSYVHLFCLVPYTPGFHSLINVYVFSPLFLIMSLCVIVCLCCGLLSGALLLPCSVFLARYYFYVLYFVVRN